MVLIYAIKPNVEKKFKLVLSFYSTVFFLGGGLVGSVQIKPVLFLFAFGLLAATKTLFKRNKNNVIIICNNKHSFTSPNKRNDHIS